MGQLPNVYVVHAIPGRIRLRVPERRGDKAFFADMTARLNALPSVVSAAANPVTGSVLIQFTGTLEHLMTEAADLLAQTRLHQSPPPVRPVMDRVKEEFNGLDSYLRRLTGGDTDAKSAVFLGLVGLSAIQLLRGNFLAPAATMLWYAGDLAMRSQTSHRQTNPAGPAKAAVGERPARTAPPTRTSRRRS
jgi:hypothetical protein